MKKILLTVISLLLIQVSFAQLACNGWKYSRTVTLGTATPSANFQVKVTLSAGQYTNMNASGDDLRFQDATGADCDYYIETWNTSGTSTIWVEVATSGTTSLTMYYGYSAATAASNGDATFLFFDSFTGSSINSSKWSVLNSATSSVTVSGGEVSVNSGTSGGAGSQIIAQTGFTPSDGVMIEAVVGTGGTIVGTNCGTRVSFCGATSISGNSSYFGYDDPNNSQYAVWSTGRNNINTNSAFHRNSGTDATYNDVTVTAAGVTVGIALETGRVEYFRGDTSKSISTTDVPSATLYPVFSHTLHYPCYPNTDMSQKIAEVRVRKYSSSYSTTVTVGSESATSCTKTWTDASSASWNDANSWTPSGVPGITTSVIVPSGVPQGPGLTSGTSAIVQDLTVLSGGLVLVGATRSITVTGNLTNNGTTTGPGTIILGGTTSQTISGTGAVRNFQLNSGAVATIGAGIVVTVTGNFTNNGTISGAGKVKLTVASGQTITGIGTVSNLELNNGSGATISSGANKLNITGLLTITSGTLTTNGNLVLKSTSPTATAMVGPVLGAISGDVVHERYLSAPANGSGGRGWRLLTSPLANNATNNSIFYHWQNNGVNDGTGIELWNPSGTGAGGNGLAPGNSPSIRSYNYITNTYVPVTDTKNTMLFTGTSNNTFLVFVSGSYGSGNIISGAAATNADATGALITGTQNYSFTAPNASNIYYLMGNPYACPIDFDKVYNNAGTGNIAQKFWVIDPNLSNFGAYATVTYTAGFYVSSSCNQDKYIQTGQGFFVEAATPNVLSTVSVEENDKDTDPAHQANVMRTNGSALELFRIKLYKDINGVATQMDGAVVASHETSNNGIDDVDGLKFGNFNENIGILSSGKVLAVEARQLLDNNDTVHVTLSNMQQTTYQLVLKPSLNMAASGLYATLIDNFTNTTTPVSLSAITTYSFTVTGSAASTGTNRFQVVFNTITPLAIKFVNINAIKQNDKVNVQWTVASQDGIRSYDIERSSDAKTFTKVTTIAAGGDNAYSYKDETPLNGNNYYRIKAIARSTNNSVYSNVARVNMNSMGAELNTYPNPVRDGHLQISVANLAKGNYTITLYNSAGQKAATKQMSYETGSAVIEMNITSLPDGIYMMHLANNNGETIAEQKIIKQ